MEFKQTGSIAEIENDKHKMSFEFLVGLKQLIKDNLQHCDPPQIHPANEVSLQFL